MIDFSIPRECVYRTFDDHPGSCPRCGGSLRLHPATFLVATRRGRRATDRFMVSGDIGWFCRRCPTVVINPRRLDEFLQAPPPHWNVGDEFALLGIVDLEAVPPEKRHLPIGDEGCPLPLVEFTRISSLDEELVDSPGQSPAPRQPASLLRREGTFEERYEDVLQNIEFGIVCVSREHPEMNDWQALSAIEALTRAYQAEARKQRMVRPSLDPLGDMVYESVRPLCEWRLGREGPLGEKGEPAQLPLQPITLEEMIDCLKRIRKSIHFWTRKCGRRGYLTFVEQHVV